MSLVKVAVVSALTAAALSACGIQAKPTVGTPNANHASGSHAKFDDPRIKHVACLHAAGLPFHEYFTKAGIPAIQVGAYPTGPTILFYNSPGYAEGLRMAGKAQGAELIGAALMYPNRASNTLDTRVENCTAVTVKG
jgi:hypothetical protein